MAQQAQIFDTIAAMKRRMAQLDDASDSDNSIQHTSNRGNKLKRKAKYVQEGHLGQGDGPRAYKRKIRYNGFEREVISRRPPRLDPDGDAVEEDDDESNPDLSPAEDDPYQDVRIENILMPLTSAADLDKHPAMSVAYTSRVLEEMVVNTEEMVYREQSALWRAKSILTRLRGDEIWAPSGLFNTDNDVALLRSMAPGDGVATGDLESTQGAGSTANWDAMSNARLQTDLEDGIHAESNAQDHAIQDATQGLQNNLKTKDQLTVEDGFPILRQDHAVPNNAKATEAGSEEALSLSKHTSSNLPTEQSTTEGAAIKTEDTGNNALEESRSQTTAANPDRDEHGLAAETQDADDAKVKPSDEANGIQQDEDVEDAQMEDVDDTNIAHRMTTRAKAQANSEATGPTPEAQSGFPSPHLSHSTSIPTIHPIYIPPHTSVPTSSQGLVSYLSDDARRLLSVYVQKQEEVVRQADSLLSGLRKAVRLRNQVWRWCRQEGHVGEMSDGEDWVDAEEWGLDGPLRKGEEVEDEEIQVTGKTRRNRRAAA